MSSRLSDSLNEPKEPRSSLAEQRFGFVAIATPLARLVIHILTLVVLLAYAWECLQLCRLAIDVTMFLISSSVTVALKDHSALTANLTYRLLNTSGGLSSPG